MTTASATARQLGLLSCHDCHLLVEPPKGEDHALACPRCGANLHQRKPYSVSRTWGLVIAATILYIPANVLPMTITSSIAGVQADTIMSGVIYFIHSDSWGIALVIFVASIFVPLLKLLTLIYLLLSVQLGWHSRPKDRTVLYRLTEAVGRWSMLDVFVVTILVALVKLGAVASIEAGPATVYFAAVVVITMFAADSFDPRLIWDALEEES